MIYDTGTHHRQIVLTQFPGLADVLPIRTYWPVRPQLSAISSQVLTGRLGNPIHIGPIQYTLDALAIQYTLCDSSSPMKNRIMCTASFA